MHLEATGSAPHSHPKFGASDLGARGGRLGSESSLHCPLPPLPSRTYFSVEGKIKNLPLEGFERTPSSFQGRSAFMQVPSFSVKAWVSVST